MNAAVTAAILAIATGSSWQAKATALPLGAATGYNAFALSNFTEYNTDSWGKIAVGGNFAPASGGFTIASQHGGDGAGVYDIVVGGNFTNVYASLGGGDIFVGGNLTWTGPTLPHNAYVNGNFSNPASGGSVGGTVYYQGTYSSGTALSHVHTTSATPAPIDFLSARTELQSISANLASQTANGSVSNNGYGTYTLAGTNTATNVFNLSGGSYSGVTFNISAPSGSTVIVNVSGTSDSFNGGSINFSGVTAHDVIFNFSSATTLALGSIGFNGSILAPYASFTGNYGQINGQLIADNIAGTTELHDVLFTGTLPSGSSAGTTHQSVTPEPSTWVLLGAGIALIGVAKKRR